MSGTEDEALGGRECRMWEDSECLSDSLHVTHGQHDCCQAGVETTTSGDPDRAMSVKRSAEELALLLGLLTCLMLAKTRFDLESKERTLLEESLAQIAQPLSRAGWQRRELLHERTSDG